MFTVSDDLQYLFHNSLEFGLRKGHSTIQQCHRLTDIILKAFEDRKYCPAVFLDVSQAFDKVWHPDLPLKIQQTLPQQYFTLLQSYLQHRYLEFRPSLPLNTTV